MSTKGFARADGRRNRQAILQAAADVMLENFQASISDVAERAGLTRATVYRHYADRDTLMREMARVSAMQLIPALLDEIHPLPWREAVRVLATRVIELGASYREIVVVIAPHLEEVAQIAVEQEPSLAEIAARRKAGDFHSPSSDEWLALCLRTLCLSAIKRLADPALDPTTVVDELARTLSDLVTSPSLTR